MGIFFDTNVLLDIALGRAPFAEASFSAYRRVCASGEPPWIAPHSLATFHYILAQSRGRDAAASATRDLVMTATIACFDHESARVALDLGLADFEDAMIVAAALREQARLILTRNQRDFRGVPLPIQSPEDFLADGVKG